MELLKELDDVCKEKWVLACLDKSKSKNHEEDLLTRLYRLVHAGQLSDAEIATVLYSKDTPPKDARYRTLKTRLKEVFLNAFLMGEQEVPSYKTYDEAFRNGHRLLCIVRLLAERKKYSAARRIAEQTFQNVRDYENVQINQGLTEILASLNLGSHHNEEKFYYYHKLSEYYNKALFDLSIVSSYYRQIRNHIYINKTPRSQLGLMAETFAANCAEIKENYPKSSTIQAMVSSLEIMSHELSGEYRKAIKASIRGEKNLKNCKGISYLTLINFTVKRIESIIKLQDFELGKHQIKEAERNILTSKFSKIAVHELGIILGFRTALYDFALQHFIRLNLNPLKNTLSTKMLESHLLTEACLNFLLATNRLNISKTEFKLKRFRIGSFINRVPSLSKNKGVSNIQILTYQHLFLLIKGKQDELINRQEALKIYARRHLRGPENIRNRSFFKLLSIIVKANFNRLTTIKKAKNTLATLQEAKDRINLNDTELVPYEALWEIALEHLEVRKADEQELTRLSSVQHPDKKA